MHITKKNLFIVGYGLGGGFGGIHDYVVVNAPDHDSASGEAYEMACEEYENYAGMYGLSSYEECLEEAGGDHDQAEYLYNEERETWIEFTCFPWSREEEKICRNRGNYYNRYKDITDVKDAGKTNRAG